MPTPNKDFGVSNDLLSVQSRGESNTNTKLPAPKYKVPRIKKIPNIKAPPKYCHKKAAYIIKQMKILSKKMMKSFRMIFVSKS